MYICTHTFIYTHIHTYIQIYTYPHTHTHTHICNLLSPTVRGLNIYIFSVDRLLGWIHNSMSCWSIIGHTGYSLIRVVVGTLYQRNPVISFACFQVLNDLSDVCEVDTSIIHTLQVKKLRFCECKWLAQGYSKRLNWDCMSDSLHSWHFGDKQHELRKCMDMNSTLSDLWPGNPCAFIVFSVKRCCSCMGPRCS